MGSYEESRQLAAQRLAQSQERPQEQEQEQNSQENQVFLPSPDRIRPGMQLELQEERPLTVQSFMEEEDPEDRDKQEDLYAADNF